MSDVIVTLVHGTWGRVRLPFAGPLWFEEGSEFVQLLRSHFKENGIDADIVAFRWSGANSVVARSEASHQLARLLYHQKRAQPKARQALVGHSHGGTLCLLALGQLAEDVDPLVITLATPFMEIINSESAPSAAAIKALAAKEALKPAMSVIAVAVSMLWANRGHQADDVSYNLVLAVGAACASFVPLFLGTSRDGEGPEDLAWVRNGRLTPTDLEALTAGGATIRPPREVLVIRGVDDEANFALTAGSIAARLSTMGVNMSVAILRALTWIFYLYFFIFWIGALDKKLSPLIDGYMYPLLASPFFVYSASGAFIVFCFMPFVACLLKSVYGRELAIGGYFCEIKSGSAPDAACGISTVTLPPTARGGLRHGIYRNKLVPKAIAEFVARRSVLGDPREDHSVS